MLFSLAAPQDHGTASLLLALAGVLALAKILGELARRVGQPSVLGELAAGILLGPSVLGLLQPDEPVIQLLAELGVIILLFEIGLHTDVRSILRVGGPAAAVGLVGVVLPFGLGLAVSHWLGIEGISAVVCSAALTATSIGISARVLGDVGRLDSPEGRVVIGAAVLDDLVGLIILSIVATLAAGGSLGAPSIIRTAGAALGFVVGALVAGRLLVPPLLRLASGVRIPGALGVFALAFALAMAAAAQASGSAMIIGALAAGLVLHASKERRHIDIAVIGLGRVFVPVFFASVAAAVDLAMLRDLQVLLIGGALIVVGIAGKFAAGYAPWWFQGNKAIIGVAMVPRGEVGLIFAQMGLATGALDARLFSAVVLMVLVTTLVTPPWLAWLAGPGIPAPHDDEGPDELVAG